MEPVHQRVMNLDRDGHQHAAPNVSAFAKGDFGNSVLASGIARVGDACERNPGDDRVIDEVVAVYARVQRRWLDARPLDYRRGPFVERAKLFLKIEVDKSEALV